MYKKGDKVLYGTQGVCSVEDVTEKKWEGKTVEYYVLKPVYGENSTFFVPADNEQLTAKMRGIISEDEVHKLIGIMDEGDTIWIDGDNRRTEEYKKIISGGDRLELIKLLKTLYTHREMQSAKGKKLHQCDEKIFRTAQKMIHEEFAIVLQIQPEDVGSFINNEINHLEQMQPVIA